eukprot:4577800-Pyramimonas_sp.AAC.1
MARRTWGPHSLACTQSHSGVLSASLPLLAQEDPYSEEPAIWARAASQRGNPKPVRVDVKGYSVDVKGYSVDVKGYS